MKRRQLMVLLIVLLIFLFALPALAVICIECGTQNSNDALYCNRCGIKLHNSQITEEKLELYKEASELVEQEKFDEAISLLRQYCIQNKEDTQAAIILAKAYLGKCDLLKMNGDEQYKSLVLKPFEIGKSIVTRHSYLSNPKYFAEGCYIISYSFMINNRQFKSERYIKKAIKISPSPADQSRYYLMWGTAAAISSLENNDDIRFKKAKKHLEKVINMNASDDHKALSYYWIGTLYSKFYIKKEAIKKLNNALEYAKKKSTRMRIQRQLASIQG